MVWAAAYVDGIREGLSVVEAASWADKIVDNLHEWQNKIPKISLAHNLLWDK